ncbi:hypothetical protein LZ575_19970 [Antarcticibacterium sp. 1MA-6-2]|uniref:hypothetical protein n=1 Tax=Antarcticibacterium sp. 1MA-6-2 TaxID=2908210 RepID=UPI001F2C2DB0|nr:hypothetical protein [Antarcticibacterium sp. 1MA-6-2]UJH90940.1 hypothetical protein LZ575_19970 [Antarcticibacterium sp. 1MA-6-2]
MDKEGLEEWQNRWKEVFDKISKSMPGLLEAGKILEEESPEAFWQLCRYGWYFGYDSLPKTPVELAREIKKGNQREVDDFLIKYYEDELESIERRLVGRYPHRTMVLQEAFQNHREKRYYSSITLFLTQVDGVCKELTGNIFFTTEEIKGVKIRKPKIAKAFNEEEVFFKPFLVPLKETSSINSHWTKLNSFPLRLNRHEILHGEDFDYASQMNSLKVISLLNYISDILTYEAKQ